jgi:ribosomal protein S18 acetylase RimI-like enzyme
MTIALRQTPSLTVRELRTSDIAAVSELAGRIWRAHYPSIISREQIEYMLETMCSPTALENQIKEKYQKIFVLEETDVLVGYAVLEPKSPDHWYLDKLYVDTERHGKGLGGTLFTHIIQTLHPTQITLRVNRANVKAINFYFKHGFFITALDVLKLEHGYLMDDFLMRWNA